MIFIDASALVAILAREVDADDLVNRADVNRPAVTSPLAIYEAALAISRIHAIPVPQAQTHVHALLTQLDASVAPITENIGARALDAFERFGKGRHPAGLNMGDCFAYASAAEAGARLLCKGADFPQTDALLG